ncbi:TAXI family TRAP transporter solute-binding subunit [Schumannella sp. 10F1B-5-1]|uniref:TAXI family TRAP transporter solute-binding subunit n=1 Tax=Schumannella sp. 10F1B-5-1 TaxID=2590780 RepID=UPI001131C6EB|nr:TAXI family TRAP transporter solute-binding subunit [Schumannella sp. 10F1B-5-1]TPW76873.1 TAXI family TRAP transporter solute-binding subunit [Schumannella sp. 10F1B-5-1]
MSGRAAVTRRTVLVGAAGLAGAAVAALAGCTATPTQRIALACGERGGTYLLFGELLRDAMTRRGLATLTARETDGSVDNLRLLADRDVDLALTLADAVAGAGADIVAIGRVYQNSLQCVVRADSPIFGLADLAGRRVSTGAAGSGATISATRVLEAAGLLPFDGAVPAHPVETVTRHLPDALSDLSSGAVDALFWSGGVPNPKIAEASRDGAVRLIPLSDALPAVSRRFPDTYFPVAIPSGIYDAARPVDTLGVANLLVARRELDDALVAGLVDLLIEDAANLVPVGSASVQFLTASSLIDTAPLPLHPAATRRYRERYG